MRITFEGGSDHSFRSQLERDVAAELDRLNIAWRYEVSVTLPDGRSIAYLPDFTIDADINNLGLPRWIECKPQQMLYELRDLTGVTRRAGEYFKADVTVDGFTAADIIDRDQHELAKPKRLAELTGESVLVIGGVQGTSSLSILLTETGATFSRSHPFVNQRGAQKAKERAERDARYEAEAAKRLAEYQRERDEKFAREQEQRASNVRHMVEHLSPIAPKFTSACHGCRMTGADGGVYRVPYNDGTERWERVCALCQARARGGA